MAKIQFVQPSQTVKPQAAAAPTRTWVSPFLKREGRAKGPAAEPAIPEGITIVAKVESKAYGLDGKPATLALTVDENGKYRVAFPGARGFLFDFPATGAKQVNIDACARMIAAKDDIMALVEAGVKLRNQSK